jgi:hypothetical protein
VALTGGPAEPVQRAGQLQIGPCDFPPVDLGRRDHSSDTKDEF